MRLHIGNSFALEVHGFTAFIRLPWVGQGFIGGGMTAFDSWRKLRSTGEV